MRLLKTALLGLAITMIFYAVSFGQCGPAPSPSDTSRITAAAGRPGDSINVPIYFKNTKDISAFAVYIDFDSTMLNLTNPTVDTTIDTTYYIGNVDSTVTPWDTTYAPNVDTNFNTFYNYDPSGGRLKPLDPFAQKYVLIAADNVDAVAQTANHKRIVLLLYPIELGYVAIDSGSGTAFSLPFRLSSNVTSATTTTMSFYTQTLYDASTFPPTEIGCQYSRYSDPTGDVGSDIRFTVRSGIITIDPNLSPGPQISSFTTNPTSLPAGGGQSTLSWTVSNATQITITNVNTNAQVYSSTLLSGSTTVSLTSTTTYRLTASNGTTQATADRTISVGSTPGNNNPVVQPVTGNPFTISQGETVSFQVTATDQDAGDIITLRAMSLPPNATFNQVTGTSSVTGSFTFTPDFTQVGTVAATFQATDDKNGTSNMLTVLITVKAIEYDRLFSTSAVGQRPVGGLPGKQSIYFPINLVTSKTVYGVQFDMTYNFLFFTVDSFVVTGRIPDYVVYDDIGQTPGEIRVVAFGLDNEPVVNIQDTTAIMYAVMSIDSAASPGWYGVGIGNGWESTNPDPNFPGLALVTDSGIVQVDRLGDVNADTLVNVADLVNIVAYIINNFTLNERQFEAADVVVNDTVNVFDLVGVVNMIYGIPVNPAPSMYNPSEFASVSLNYNDLEAGGNEMMVVKSELPTDIAAVEMEIQYDPTAVILGKPTATADASHLTFRYNDKTPGRLKVLMHFENPVNSSALIQKGAADLVNIPIIARSNVVAGDKNQLKITQALLSTPEAARVAVEGVDNPNPIIPGSFTLSQNYPNPFNPTTTIDFSIQAPQHVNLTIYNIIGQHVKTLVDGYMTAGAHTIEWDATDDGGQGVATGIYLYRLQIDKKSQAKKMLFLK